MASPLRLLLLEDPSDLTCDSCSAVTEYHTEAPARAGTRLLPHVREHLSRSPPCALPHRWVLQRLAGE